MHRKYPKLLFRLLTGFLPHIHLHLIDSIINHRLNNAVLALKYCWLDVKDPTPPSPHHLIPKKTTKLTNFLLKIYIRSKISVTQNGCSFFFSPAWAKAKLGYSHHCHKSVCLLGRATADRALRALTAPPVGKYGNLWCSTVGRHLAWKSSTRYLTHSLIPLGVNVPGHLVNFVCQHFRQIQEALVTYMYTVTKLGYPSKTSAPRNK